MHSVGDIIYIISNKKRQIFPAQVVEQVIRKTLAGQEVTYKVQVPGHERAAPLDLHSFDGTVHESLEKAKSFLYEQASAAIESMLKDAQELSASFDRPAPMPVPKKDNGTSKLKVKLDDGTSATVTLPEVQ